MRRISYARFLAIGLMVSMLGGCGGGSEPAADLDEEDAALPARYGIYAEQDGQLGRIDGDRNFQIATWEGRSTLKPHVTFIIFDRALADRGVRLADAVSLRRLARVRNDIAASGAVQPVSKDIWVAPNLPELTVPIDFAPVSGNPEMIRVLPAGRLQPGLYVVEFRHGDTAIGGRFGVDWSGADQKGFIAQNCVDRYAGKPTKYRLCSAGPPQQAAAVAPAGPGLALRQVQAVKGTDQGLPILTVQGVVVNVSDRVQRVPLLVATIKDLQGKELDRWTFTAEASTLPPGGSTGFRTETVYPANSSTNVGVTFVADKSS
jgi:hypothetical protein